MVVKPASPIHQEMQMRVVLIKIIIVNEAGSSLYVKFAQTILHFHHGSDVYPSLADPEGKGAIAS